MYKRAEYLTIKSRLEEPRKFIQVVMGPRQVGNPLLSNKSFRTWACPINSSQWYHPSRAFIVGDGGIRAEDFLTMDIRKLFN